MKQEVRDVIQKHVMAYQPRAGKCIIYSTCGVFAVADELDISFDSADKLVGDWIDEWAD